MTACEALNCWLNEGRPPGGAGHEAHALTCPTCEAALRAARELEGALANAPGVRAPSGFVERLMVSLPAPSSALALQQARREERWPWMLSSSVASLVAFATWLAWPAHSTALPALGLEWATAKGPSLSLGAQASLSLAFAMAATAGGWGLTRLVHLWTLRAAAWHRPSLLP